MARTTDTRTRVRELANRIHAEGGTPTPTLIREMLGSGSPNTIVSELRAWSADLSASGNSVPERAQKALTTTKVVAERLGLDELASLLSDVAATGGALTEQVKELLDAGAGLRQEKDSLSSLTALCAELVNQLRTDRAWMREELEKISHRFEGVQKHMLMNISTAREETIRWKEEAKFAKEEAQTWRHALLSKTDALQTENARLRGMLEALGHPLPRLS